MAGTLKPSHTLGPDPMTYRDPDALCLPMRPPQHAAPVGFPGRRKPAAQPHLAARLGRAVRQALQLFVTIVAWALGLGLVTGAIVLIATVTAPKHAATGPTAAAGQSAQNSVLSPKSESILWRTAHSHPGHIGYRVVAFTGHGNRKISHFVLSARLDWQLKWTYNCRSERAATGQFKLMGADFAADNATLRTMVEVAGTSGQGSASLQAAGARHYLVVRSGCSWSIKVVQVL